ncbi:MAG: ABC transporter permease [Planctomycetota bacterium]
MLRQILSIARNTLVESLRQPLFFILIMICGMLQAFNTASASYSMGYSTTAEVSGDDKLLLDIGMATVFVIGTLLAAFQATSVVSREIKDKTVLTVIAKPVERPTVIVGKYLGVLGAIMLAVVVMITFLLFGLRHEVLSTAADEYDQPALVFGLGAVSISIVFAAFGNFFYGWSFPQISTVGLGLLVPTGYAATLLFSKEWELQPISTDFKPQVFVACVSLAAAIMVLTSVATAVSTRLGQVMTVVACAGVFVLGLLSNHLLGRIAFENDFVAVIRTAEPDAFRFTEFDSRSARYSVELVTFPEVSLEPGQAVWYGPDPTGFTMAVPEYEPQTEADPGRPTIAIAEADGTSLVLTQAGESPVRVQRPPAPGDYIFLQPTSRNAAAMAAWAVVPNMHYFWLLDAVTQNREIPPGHLLLVCLYSVAQSAVFVCLAVVLFQRRDVG